MRYMAIFSNKVLISAATCWFVAQLLKVIISMIVTGKFNAERLVGSGGMPSSHSATVVGLSYSVGLTEGFGSSMFAISFILAIIVVHDAINLRRSVGEQAMILNLEFDEIIRERRRRPFKEMVGHKPLEIVAGIFLGLLITFIYFYVIWK